MKAEPIFEDGCPVCEHHNADHMEWEARFQALEATDREAARAMLMAHLTTEFFEVMAERRAAAIAEAHATPCFARTPLQSALVEKW